jgi:hypothetical protein
MSEASLGVGRFIPYFLNRCLPLPLIAAGDNNVRAGLGQRKRRLIAEAAGGAGDDRQPAVLRRDFDPCRTSHATTSRKKQTRLS